MNPEEVSALVEAVNKDPTLTNHLSPRELHIFEEYCVKGGKTLKKLAEEINGLYDFPISAERVRQIKVKALRKINNKLTTKAKNNTDGWSYRGYFHSARGLREVTIGEILQNGRFFEGWVFVDTGEPVTEEDLMYSKMKELIAKRTALKMKRSK